MEVKLSKYFIVMSLHLLSSQSYSQEYTLTQLGLGCEDVEHSDEGVYQLCPVYLLENQSDTINKFEVEIWKYDADFGQSLEVKNISNFNGYTKVLNVTFTYDACCVSLNDHFILVGDGREPLQLNGLYNVHCDGPEPKYDYIFPNEPFGEDRNIIKAKKIYKGMSVVDTVDVISRLVLTEGGIVEVISY